jgi:hypothetical protein
MDTPLPNASPETNSVPLKAWVVAADMGYGHQRAVYPLRKIAEDHVIVVGKNDAASKTEKQLWSRLLAGYGAISRARSIPIVGKQIFQMLDSLLHIPSFYPSRNLSRPTFQVELLNSLIRQGLCAGMLDYVASKHLPIVTSFFAPAIAADMRGTHRVYCIICDADLNRVWVAREPWESRISYFAPCGKAAQRLKAYGVPEERIFLTGFPLPEELLGGPDFPVLRHDLGQRLNYLDPSQRFWPLHNRNVEHFLGADNCVFRRERTLTLTYTVGGVGAQKEIGVSIVRSLAERIRAGTIAVNLMAGTRTEVRDYFVEAASGLVQNSPNLRIHHAPTTKAYFDQFVTILRETDILWTKPSELSFYCALGIPIIISPPIGSQERFNRQWLFEMQAGIRQEDPAYTNEWLFDRLHDGLLAEMAWSGFLKARKLGTYRILEVLRDGKMSRDPSPVMR